MVTFQENEILFTIDIQGNPLFKTGLQKNPPALTEINNKGKG